MRRGEIEGLFVILARKIVERLRVHQDLASLAQPNDLRIEADQQVLMLLGDESVHSFNLDRRRGFQFSDWALDRAAVGH